MTIFRRDGQVRANVIQVAPRVSAPIINLPIRDNQFVKGGDLLFELDPSTFEAAYERALANLDSTKDRLASLDQQIAAARASVSQYESLIQQAEARVASARAQLDDDMKQFERFRVLVEDDRIPEARFDDIRRNRDVSDANLRSAEGALLEAQAALIQAQATLEATIATRGATGDDNAELRAAQAALREAELDLSFTKVRASVDGYISNLQIRLGSQAVANQPILALIDADSFWIDAYFRETLTGGIQADNRAAITLMSHPDVVIPGIVESVGWGISTQDGSSGHDLLPVVQPTYQWIRLAQRIPVRIDVGKLPGDIRLRVGTTASVLVMTGTSGMDDGNGVPPAPKLLQ